jgi:2-oxoglutarate dehydrogenase complex dehydrogenase (E1) component-like enzyme
VSSSCTPCRTRPFARHLRDITGAEEVVWVQEEPENMGAWEFIRTPLQSLIGDLPLQVIARPRSSSPAEGSAARHTQNQDRLIAQVWTVAAARTTPARKGSKR